MADVHYRIEHQIYDKQTGEDYWVTGRKLTIGTSAREFQSIKSREAAIKQIQMCHARALELGEKAPPMRVVECQVVAEFSMDEPTLF